MTTRPAPSELNPTAELREWHFSSVARDVVIGRFYYHADWEDGTWGQVINIVEKRFYRDHYFFVTAQGFYFKAYIKNMHLNGKKKE